MNYLYENLNINKVDEFLERFYSKASCSIDVNEFTHRVLDRIDYYRDNLEKEMILSGESDLLINNHIVLSAVYNSIVIKGYYKTG